MRLKFILESETERYVSYDVYNADPTPQSYLEVLRGIPNKEDMLPYAEAFQCIEEQVPNSPVVLIQAVFHGEMIKAVFRKGIS